MVIKRLLLILSFWYPLYLQATSVVCEYGAVQETLDLDHIEPLSCAMYNELLPKEDDPVFIARLVSCAHERNYVHYVDAHLLHTALFHTSASPYAYPGLQTRQASADRPENVPRVLFNPVNNLPLTENITYFALYANHADYVGTLTDIYTQTPAGEFICAFLGARYGTNDIERAQAEYMLGRCYQAGGGVEKDLHKALQCYTQALAHADEQLQPQLWYALGSVYELCTDIPDHAIHALTYYTKAAENSRDRYSKGAALYALGNWSALYNHNGKKADEYYTAALAVAPDASLITAIKYAQATLYYRGTYGIGINYQKAAQLFEEVTRSDSGYKLSTALALGEIYRTGGYGVIADAARARNWYTSVINTPTATAHHMSMANFGLAELYRVHNERVKAESLYKTLLAHCSDGDCMQPMIYNGLASLYCFSCDQISADYARAKEYYTHSFEQSINAQARAVAANGLATLYYHGAPSVPQEIDTAINYYHYVSKQNDDEYLQAHAHQLLGTFYAKSDLDQALAHLQQAAEQNVNVQAQEKARVALQVLHEQSVQMASRVNKVLARS